MGSELMATDDRAAVLAMIARGELTTGLTGRQLRALEARLNDALAAAAMVSLDLREAGGPELHGLPFHLHFMTGVGTGFLRHCRDAISAARRARGKKKGAR